MRGFFGVVNSDGNMIYHCENTPYKINKIETTAFLIHLTRSFADNRIRRKKNLLFVPREQNNPNGI